MVSTLEFRVMSIESESGCSLLSLFSPDVEKTVSLCMPDTALRKLDNLVSLGDPVSISFVSISFGRDEKKMDRSEKENK